MGYLHLDYYRSKLHRLHGRAVIRAWPKPLLPAFFILFLALRAAATTYYVDINSTNPVPPYTNWDIAATDIQSAVDLTTNDDIVLVNPGIYQPVDVTNAISLEGVDGSTATAINGNGAMTCIYLADGATLSGFTITNGDAPFGGGVLCADTNAFISSCLIINNTATANGGGAEYGTYNDCVFAGNTDTRFGGAVNLGVLNNCLLYNNHSTNGYGGGAAASTLNNCVISNNFAYQVGGGVWNSIVMNSLIVSNSTGPELGTGAFETGVGGGADSSALSNCIVQGNTAAIGGGVSAGGGDRILSSVILNSTIIGNLATDGGGCAAPYGFIFMTNCIIISNCAYNGGGVYANSSFYNCLVADNTATNDGGGAWQCDLYSCTVCQNSAGSQGGGLYARLAENCIVYYNTALQYSNVADMYFVTNCCLGPDATGFSGCFTNAPQFVNPDAGDFHLQSNSPCINSGNNAYVFSTTDLDGNPRIVGGTVDVGAYEYQSPVSVLPYLWLEQYALPITTNTDTSHPNGTVFDVYQDWIAGLDPTNPASVLAMLPPADTNNVSGITVSWQSVSGIDYRLERSTNLSAQPPFATIQGNIAGQTGTTSYTDTTATNNVPYMYRVGVQ